MTVGVLEGLVRNQGDVWSYALDELRRYFESLAAAGQQPDGELLAPSRMAWAGTEPPQAVNELHGLPLSAAMLLGRRTAELHRVLAAAGDDAAFGSEPLTEDALAEAIVSTRRSAERTRSALAAAREHLDERLRTRTEICSSNSICRASRIMPRCSRRWNRPVCGSACTAICISHTCSG